MNILVTGGLGVVGRPLVERLLNHNHRLRVLDTASADVPAGVEFAAADVTDFAAVREAVRDIHAVIHLAAIPNPAGAAGEEIFRINCAGTYNIYEAAAQEGIRRVVVASSINALGLNYGLKGFPIRYLPVDEEHPTFTSDPYSFSKRIAEEIGAYYWRREGISGVQLRLPGVIPMTGEFRRMVEQFAPIMRMASERVRVMSVEARLERAQQLLAELDELRSTRFHEKPRSFEMPEGDWQPNLDDPLQLVFFGVTDFWAVISAENSALAFELGVTASYEGSHELFVADAANMNGLEAEILADTFYPEAERRRPLKGAEPLVSYEKARQLIGYQPEASAWFPG